MSENRTSKAFQSKFKATDKGAYGGYVGNCLPIFQNKATNQMCNESNIRNEMQQSIKKMIQQHKEIKEIYTILEQDSYRKYQPYFALWIQDWIVKLNLDIKSIIVKGLNRNKTEQEIIQELEAMNSEVYQLYKEQIQSKIRKEIELRQEKEEER